MKALFKRLTFYGLLAFGVFWTGWTWNSGNDLHDRVVAPVAGGLRTPVALNHADEIVSPLKLHEIERPRAFIDESNPFASTQWMAAQAPVAPPLPVAAPVVQQTPTAPQLPFVFAGKLEETPGRWIVYLAKGEQSFAITKGEVFDTDYRFDGVEDGHLIIFYLPLATKQYLPIAKDEQFQ